MNRKNQSVTLMKGDMNTKNNPNKEKKIIFVILKKAANDAKAINAIAMNISAFPDKVFTNKHCKFNGSMKALHTAISQSP